MLATSLVTILQDASSTLAVFVPAAGTFWGFLLLLFGYRYYRLMAIIAGGALGALLGTLGCQAYITEQPMVMYLFGLIGSGLGALLFFYIYTFLFGFLLGGLVTGIVGVGILYGFGVEAKESWFGLLASIILVGVAGGALSLVFQRFFWIIITSLGGAAVTLASAGIAAGGHTFLLNMKMLDWVLAGVGFVVLFTVGMVVQIRTTAAEEEKDEAAEKTSGRSSDRKSRKQSRKKS